MQKKALWRTAALPLAIIAVSILVSLLMVSLSRKPVEKASHLFPLQKVEVVSVVSRSVVVPVFSQGVVEPRTGIRLLPEVTGEIVSVSPQWENGGYFRKGERFLQIDELNYKNQLEKAQAALVRADGNLVQEQGVADVARKDWEKRDPATDNSAARSLALREPQLASARAQVDASRAEVDAARRSLKKTRLVAPFDGILAKKGADIGQYVAAGQLLAEFYGIDVAEVRVPLTEAQTAFLDLAPVGRRMRIPVRLFYQVESGVQETSGTLVRTEGLLDPVTKVLYAVIEVKDPYGLRKKQQHPLRLGSFVRVEIPGRKVDNIFVLPGKALRTGNRLWVVDNENRLVKRDVAVLPVQGEEIYISAGLTAGERVVTGSMVDPIEGKVVAPEVLR